MLVEELVVKAGNASKGVNRFHDLAHTPVSFSPAFGVGTLVITLNCSQQFHGLWERLNSFIDRHALIV